MGAGASAQPEAEQEEPQQKKLPTRREACDASFATLQGMVTRSGVGFDLHKYEDGSGLILGGYKIDCDYKIVAHSDGDVLIHALMDAILGALALGDIGHHFPDTDPQYKGCSSRELLKKIYQFLLG